MFISSWWQRQNLKKRAVIGYLLLVTLPVLLLVIVMYSWLLSSAEDAAYSAFKDEVERSSGLIKSAILQIETVSGLLQYNISLTRFLNGDIQNIADRVIIYIRELDPLLSSVEVSVPYVNDVQIYTRMPHPPGIGDDFFKPWLELPLDVIPLTKNIDVGGIWLYRHNENNIITNFLFYKLLLDSQLRSIIGVIEISVEPSLFLELLYPQLLDKGYISVRDIASEPKEERSYFIGSAASWENDQKHSLYRKEIQLQMTSLVFEVVEWKRKSEFISLRFGALFFGGSVMLLVLFSWIYSFLFSSITRRIVAFSSHIQSTNHESMMLYDEPLREDELGILILHYNEFILRIRSLLDTVRIAEIRQKEASLLALQYQMTPHFLYNALESIRMLAEEGNSEKAADMAYLLGRFSRYSLTETSSVATVSEELEHAESFLEIHKARMGTRLKYDVVINGDPKRISCPRFILQPIVENSVKHGIGNRRSGGLIRIEVKAFIEKSQIIVEDDGIGIDGSGENGFSGRNLDPGHGIGLESVNTRLIYFGGSGSGVIMSNRPGGGTQVIITITPKEEGQKNENIGC